jgi:hypothetical protein
VEGLENASRGIEEISTWLTSSKVHCSSLGFFKDVSCSEKNSVKPMKREREKYRD